MPHQVKCTSCDAKGEHWHWEDEPFLSRNFRGPCNSCGGKKFWLLYSEHELRPLVADWPLPKLLRLGAEFWAEMGSAGPSSLTLRFIRIALKDAVMHRLLYEFRLSDWTLHCWFRRIKFAHRQHRPWVRPRKGRLVA